MKIRKVGRARPVLHKGSFNVPIEVILRLRIARNHLILAQVTNFNGKINQYYMTIDNLLAAVIAAKEGALTTTSHKKKIDKFFDHLGKRAKIRRIERVDLDEFYDLWRKSRYNVYFPKSDVVEKIRLFTFHLFDFVVTEIARCFKSDETVLAAKVDEGLKVYQSNSIREEAAHIHEYHQMEAEEIGDRYGNKLGMKLANPWNFMEISLLSDRKDIIGIIDDSNDMKRDISNLLMVWDEIVDKVWGLNFKKVAIKIAEAKKKKRPISTDEALLEAIKSAAKHPDVHAFRLVLNFSYDPSEPRRTGEYFSRVIGAIKEWDTHPYKVIRDGWEIWKDSCQARASHKHKASAT